MRSSKVNIGDKATAQQYNNLRDDAKQSSYLLVHQTSTASADVYLEGGYFSIGTNKIEIASQTITGISFPTTTNKRWLLLSATNAGVITKTYSAAGPSPAKPSIPNGEMPLAYVYLTSSGIITDDNNSTDGYIEDCRLSMNLIDDSSIVHQSGNETISGIKTFLDGKLSLRNVAGTFSGIFTNAITAARTWILPDKDGTIAMISDVTSAVDTKVSKTGNGNINGNLSIGDETVNTGNFINIWRPNSTSNQIDSYTNGVGYRDLILNSILKITQSGLFFNNIQVADTGGLISNENIKSTFTAGEDMPAKQAFRMGGTIVPFPAIGTTLASNNNSGLFNGAWQEFVVPAGKIVNINQVTMRFLTLYTSGIAQLEIRDSTGTTVLYTSGNVTPNYYGSVNYFDYGFNFTGVNLAPGTYRLYGKSVSISGNFNFTYNSNLYSGGVCSLGTSYDFDFLVNGFYVEDINKTYKASGLVNVPIAGFTEASVAANATFTGITDGNVNGLTGFTKDKPIFVQDDGSIAHTLGTNIIPAGIATSATGLLIKKNNSIVSIVATRDINAASETVTYNHNLFKIPKFIKVEGILSYSGSSSTSNTSGSWFPGNINKCSFGGNSGGFTGDTSSTYAIHGLYTAGNGNTGVIQNVTSTTFDVVWTKQGTTSSYSLGLHFTLFE